MMIINLEWYESGKYYKIHSSRYIGHLLQYINSIEGVVSCIEYPCNTIDAFCDNRLDEKALRKQIYNQYQLSCIVANYELYMIDRAN
jgi:hypothetical protein